MIFTLLSILVFGGSAVCAIWLLVIHMRRAIWGEAVRRPARRRNVHMKGWPKPDGAWVQPPKKW